MKGRRREKIRGSCGGGWSVEDEVKVMRGGGWMEGGGELVGVEGG